MNARKTKLSQRSLVSKRTFQNTRSILGKIILKGTLIKQLVNWLKNCTMIIDYEKHSDKLSIGGNFLIGYITKKYSRKASTMEFINWLCSCEIPIFELYKISPAWQMISLL